MSINFYWYNNLITNIKSMQTNSVGFWISPSEEISLEKIFIDTNNFFGILTYNNDDTTLITDNSVKIMVYPGSTVPATKLFPTKAYFIQLWSYYSENENVFVPKRDTIAPGTTGGTETFGNIQSYNNFQFEHFGNTLQSIPIIEKFGYEPHNSYLVSGPNSSNSPNSPNSPNDQYSKNIEFFGSTSDGATGNPNIYNPDEQTINLINAVTSGTGENFNVVGFDIDKDTLTVGSLKMASTNKNFDIYETNNPGSALNDNEIVSSTKAYYIKATGTGTITLKKLCPTGSTSLNNGGIPSGSTTPRFCDGATTENSCRNTYYTKNGTNYRCKWGVQPNKFETDGSNYVCQEEPLGITPFKTQNFGYEICGKDDDFSRDCTVNLNVCNVVCGKGEFEPTGTSVANTGNGKCIDYKSAERPNITFTNGSPVLPSGKTWASCGDDSDATCKACYTEDIVNSICMETDGKGGKSSCYSGKTTEITGKVHHTYEKNRNGRYSQTCEDWATRPSVANTPCTLPVCDGRAAQEGDWWIYCDNWNNSGVSRKIWNNQSTKPDSDTNKYVSYVMPDNNKCSSPTGDVNCQNIDRGYMGCTYPTNASWKGSANMHRIHSGNEAISGTTPTNCPASTEGDPDPNVPCVKNLGLVPNSFPGSPGRMGSSGDVDFNLEEAGKISRNIWGQLPNWTLCTSDNECASQKCGYMSTTGAGSKKFCCGTGINSSGWCDNLPGGFADGKNRASCGPGGWHDNFQDTITAEVTLSDGTKKTETATAYFYTCWENNSGLVGDVDAQFGDLGTTQGSCDNIAPNKSTRFITCVGTKEGQWNESWS